MNTKHFLSTLLVTGATGLFLFENFGNISLSSVVNKQGFKTLLEIKKDPFDKGKRTFVVNKADLLRDDFISHLTNNSSDEEGAYHLNKGCKENLEGNSQDKLTLGRTRKYCTVTLAVEFLEEEKVQLVEDLPENERKGAGTKVINELKRNILRAGIIEDERNINRNIALLEDGCRQRLNLSFTKENFEIAKQARSWCVTVDTPRRNEI